MLNMHTDSHGDVNEQVLMTEAGLGTEILHFLWSSWVLGIGNSCSSRDYNL